jgi:hypothetical protein
VENSAFKAQYIHLCGKYVLKGDLEQVKKIRAVLMELWSSYGHLRDKENLHYIILIDGKDVAIVVIGTLSS